MPHYDSQEAQYVRDDAPIKLFKLILENDKTGRNDMQGHNLYAVHLPNGVHVMMAGLSYLGDVTEGVYTSYNTGTALAVDAVSMVLQDMPKAPALINERTFGRGSDQVFIDMLDRLIHPHVEMILNGDAPLNFTRLAKGIDLEKGYQARRTGFAVGHGLSQIMNPKFVP